MNKGKIVDITGVGGGTVPVIVKKIMMCVGEKIFDARVAWALIEDVPPLLGRMDVFNKFDVIVREEEKEVVFKRNGKET